LLRTHGVACSGPYGDPATLLPLLIHNDIAPQHEIGIVPHWSQFPDFERAIRDPAVKVIDVCDRFDHVARDILSCRLVLSTSLHAVILAESYGIPALLVFYRGHGRGDETKFVDYFESTDRDLYARFVTSASDILQLANEASSVPAPCFRREELLAAFPYAVQARAAEPSLRWSQVQRHMLGCFEAS
jgi:pyruvyltransferase